MKKSLLLAVLLALPVAGFSAVTANNFTVNVGGAFNYSQMTMNGYKDMGMTAKQAGTSYMGGGFNVELGHLHLSQGSLIHAFDTRLGFAMNFDGISKLGGEKVELPKGCSMSFNPMYVYVGTTYAMGAKMGNGTLLVDVLGLNLGYFGASSKSVGSFGFGDDGEEEEEVASIADSSKMTMIAKDGGAFLVSLNLPLGTQYVFDNGFSVGFRHRLDFAFGSTSDEEGKVKVDGTTTTYTSKGSQFGTKDGQSSYLAYNLTVSLGYAFGL